MSLIDCKCSICNIVRAHRFTPGREGAPFLLGRSRETPVKLPGTLCTERYSVKGKGIPHQCNISNARKNLQAHCSKDPVAREMIASSFIREKVAATPSSSSVQLKTGGGKFMSISNPKQGCSSQALYTNQPIPLMFKDTQRTNIL